MIPQSGVTPDQVVELITDALQEMSIDAVSTTPVSLPSCTGACTINRPCAQQYVCKSQSCMVMLRQAIAIVTELAADAARASGEARAEDVARRRAV